MGRNQPNALPAASRAKVKLERIDRERRMVERRIRQAKFPQVKSLDTLDFTAQPSLNKALVLELARGDWLTHHVNILEMNGNSYRLASSAKRQKQAKGTTQEEATMA